MLVALGNEDEAIALFVFDANRKLLIASSDGRGFVVPEAEVVAQTRNGRQVLNLADGARARVCVPAYGTYIAALGENRKLLIFELAELPEMGRGRGVVLQRYRDGGLADVKVFDLEKGLSCRTGQKVRTFSAAEIGDWIGKRAQAGRIVPKGFSRANRFS